MIKQAVKIGIGLALLPKISIDSELQHGELSVHPLTIQSAITSIKCKRIWSYSSTCYNSYEYRS